MGATDFPRVWQFSIPIVGLQKCYQLHNFLKFSHRYCFQNCITITRLREVPNELSERQTHTHLQVVEEVPLEHEKSSPSPSLSWSALNNSIHILIKGSNDGGLYDFG